MKYKGIYWEIFSPMIKKSIEARFGGKFAEASLRNGKSEYRRLLSRSDDLGPGNPMAMNAYFAYVFAAAWLGGGKQISPLDMGRVMTDVLEGPLLRRAFGMTNLNRMPGKWQEDMRKYEKWYESYQSEYSVNWVVHFDQNRHRNGSFYYFTRCPSENSVSGKILPS